MHLGWWIRRIAAATLLTFGMGLAVLSGAAVGLELPTVDPALGDTTLPGTSGLPSTTDLPIDPQKLISPAVPETPITPPPSGPTGPTGAAGPSVTPSGSSAAQATIARRNRGNLSSSGRQRNVVNGDRGTASSAQSAPGQRVHRARASGRRNGRHRSRGASPSSPTFPLFGRSRFDRLGPITAPEAGPAGFFGRFSPSATGRANWAPPLLTIMFLIGLGGFLRVAMPASRRHP